MTRMDRINQMTTKVELSREELTMIRHAISFCMDEEDFRFPETMDFLSMLEDKIACARDRIDERAGL